MNATVHLYETRDRDTMDRIARVMWIIIAELNMSASLWYTSDHSTMALTATMDAEHVAAQITSLRQLLDLFGKRAGPKGYCAAPARNGADNGPCGVALNDDESCPNGKRHREPPCHPLCPKCRAINTGSRTDNLTHWFGAPWER